MKVGSCTFAPVLGNLYFDLDSCFYLFSDEDLIRWGWPEDVWFHVDDLSSVRLLRILENVTDV